MYKKIVMKHFISVLFTFALFSSTIAQNNATISRIKIRHADPQLIIMLINGTTDVNTPLEMSTNGNINGFSGGGFSGGFGGGRGFGGDAGGRGN